LFFFPFFRIEDFLRGVMIGACMCKLWSKRATIPGMAASTVAQYDEAVSLSE
jgi:hypothetical protein